MKNNDEAGSAKCNSHGIDVDCQGVCHRDDGGDHQMAVARNGTMAAGNIKRPLRQPAEVVLVVVLLLSQLRKLTATMQ